MNTLTQKINGKQTCQSLHTGLATVILLLVLASFPMVVTANESHNLNALFQPEISLILAEARGRVTIYDGLKNKDIEQAMDEQFDRIEHMMFIGIRYLQTDMQEIFDDDC